MTGPMSGDHVQRIGFEARIAPEPFDPDAESRRFRARNPQAGAIAVFLGQVRGEMGRAAGLELEHYPGFTESVVAASAAGARARFRLDDLLVLHRVGALQPGEPIVLVAAAARHRRDAFDAAEFMMDHLKTRAPFWKREIAPDGASTWIEPRPEDRRDLARWMESKA